MRLFTLLFLSAFIVIILGISTLASRADTPEAEQGPVLAELFTSQGCSSCPPAEAFFETLTDQEGVAVIVWHVDVWDDLVHRGSRWEDPYSDPKFTNRQRLYNAAIRGTPGLFTPQAIIGGKTSIVGSRGRDITDAIGVAAPASVSVSLVDGTVTISGDGKGKVLYVRLLREHMTDVKGGENKGRQLSGRNIALSTKTLGKWKGKATSFDLPKLKDSETCAIIVQNNDLSVLGVGMCG